MQKPELGDGAKLLVRGGLVYDHDGDVHRPAIADVRIEGTRIAAVAPDLAPLPGETVIEAAGKLVVPGLVNAHYHSHDVLTKGMFEQLPLEIWILYSRLPDAHTRLEEVRTRTLLGAWECLRNGVTTLQDILRARSAARARCWRRCARSRSVTSCRCTHTCWRPRRRPSKHA